MESFDLTKYLDIALRRKWWAIIPFLLTLLAGLTYLLIIPPIYRAYTLILVQQQKVPENFVRSIVSTTVEDRLRTIKQQVTSRTNLEKIVQEYELYGSPENNMLLDDKVALLRRMIKINVTPGQRPGETNAFMIVFRGKDPRKVMQVTNALASNFIAENLKIRESQALGTSSFLSDELESVEKRLMEKEEELKLYREKYMGGLPEQLNTNLRILERLQGQLDRLNNNLTDAENRKIVIQAQIAEERRIRAVPMVPPGSGDQRPRDIRSLRDELASLESRYTQNYPDVIRMRGMISKLEAERSESGTDLPEGEPAIPRMDQPLERQLRDIGLAIETLKAEIKKTESQITLYQTKVEETPKREQELLSLRRDYNNLQGLYNSLLNRKLEAEIAVSMEKKQKGEQFRLIDSAKMPTRPVEPDSSKIILLTLVLALGLGCGMAFLVEIMDTSFKTPEEVEKELQLPILVSMPIRYTEKELRNIKMRNVLAFASVAAGFIASVFGIVVAVKGMDKTLDFIINIFARV